MAEITEGKIIELFLLSAKKAGHDIKISRGKEARPYEIMMTCRNCWESAQYMPKEDFWTPWWGDMLQENAFLGYIDKPPLLRKCCYANREAERNKEKDRKRLIARRAVQKIAPAFYGSQKKEAEEIINALLFGIDFSEVPENDGSEKRDSWPHA